MIPLNVPLTLLGAARFPTNVPETLPAPVLVVPVPVNVPVSVLGEQVQSPGEEPLLPELDVAEAVQLWLAKPAIVTTPLHEHAPLVCVDGQVMVFPPPPLDDPLLPPLDHVG